MSLEFRLPCFLVVTLSPSFVICKMGILYNSQCNFKDYLKYVNSLEQRRCCQCWFSLISFSKSHYTHHVCSAGRHDKPCLKAFMVLITMRQLLKQRPKERTPAQRSSLYTLRSLHGGRAHNQRWTILRSKTLGALTNTEHIRNDDKTPLKDAPCWTLHGTSSQVLSFKPGRKQTESWRGCLRLQRLHTAVGYNEKHSKDLGSNSDSALHSCCDFRQDQVNETQLRNDHY